MIPCYERQRKSFGTTDSEEKEKNEKKPIYKPIRQPKIKPNYGTKAGGMNPTRKKHAVEKKP
jgi:hypothetical protein